MNTHPYDEAEKVEAMLQFLEDILGATTDSRAIIEANRWGLSLIIGEIRGRQQIVMNELDQGKFTPPA